MASDSRWSYRATLAGLGALGASFAVARVRALASLSPPDLAFFHQASWSAARGLGFSQTALEFDAGTLLGSIHLSFIRLLWVPLSALSGGPELLVATQGTLLTAGVAAAGGLIVDRQHRLPVAVLLGLSPLALSLAACDLRPLTFLVAPGVLVAAGLSRSRAAWVALGTLAVVAAREEAVYVLGAMVPFAMAQAWRTRQLASAAVLMAGVTAAAALPQLVWGHSSNIQANSDLAATVDQLLSGTRPVFRWPVELRFLGRFGLAALPALLCPELLLPGIIAWSFLAVFSQLEPAAPGHGGLHYLAVVAPFFLAATAVGLQRATVWFRGRRLWALAGVAAVMAAPELEDGLRWTSSALTSSPLHAEVARIRATTGGVLTISQAAPLLSNRPVLRIQGHFTVDAKRVNTVATEVDHALLLAHRPTEGPPALEWDLWQEALPAAGLKPVAQVQHVQVWSR